MNLTDIRIQDEYRSLLRDVTKEFYVPLLSVAAFYKRAVGFFSSTALVEIADGVAALVQNGGRIQIVASPHLSEEDIEAIKKGYERRDIVQQALWREMNDAKNDFEERRLNLLANLIADNILDIKIAFTESDFKMGMYHEKMGIISDCDGNTVAFSGSMNESHTALKENYEVIDVWCSWKSDEQKSKVDTKNSAFNSIWNNKEPNIRIIDFPELKQEILDRYKRSAITNYEKYTIVGDEPDDIPMDYDNIPVVPKNVILHDYQDEAIDAWEEKQYCGIFDMATGTGKTFTGLGAIVRLYNAVGGNLAVIIVCPYQHLVEQWVEDIEVFGIKPIIGYSSSSQKDWLKRLEKAILNQKLKVPSRKFFCFICTNATFATPKVQTLLNKIRGNALLLVDEAHNFGSERLSRLMDNKYNFRLALSATIDRHNDEEGTAKLYSFFGEKCIVYSLDRAIDEGKLTRYKYYPIITTLNDDEMDIYSGLSYEMSKCLIRGKDGKFHLNERGKMLAIKRARLVAGIEDKINKLNVAIVPYIHDKHILVYCGATTLLRDDQDYSDTSDEDIRQIDAVTGLLGNQLNMRVSQFTSREDIIERERLKKEFASGDSLQALIAIKCLDEGVNIPAIKTAFILASTTNPKEYIQRRGRVLRLAKGKDYAVIYDFLALPRALGDVPYLTDEQLRRELTLVKNELARAEEFARIAMNMAEAENIIDSIKNAYSIDDFAINVEGDYIYD